MPYIAAHPIEFQTLGQWADSASGLGPVETTILVALPEIDGATNPTGFGGRHGPDGCHGCALNCPRSSDTKAMAPCLERIESLTEKTLRLATLRREVLYAGTDAMAPRLWKTVTSSNCSASINGGHPHIRRDARPR